MPKKQTKRSLVVNGRQEGFMLPYFNNYATNLINGIKLRQEAVTSAQQAYNALRDRQTREFLNNVNSQQSKSYTSTQKQAKALHTAQTDKTFVPAVGRRQNPELDAIPVKEDNTGPLGYTAAIAPFAVASAPFAAATPTVFANPYVQAGINSYFAAEGVDDIINGRANWSTPINFLPFYGGATKTLANAVGKAYNSGKKAYDTTRLAIGLNNDIRNFAPRYSLKGGNVRNYNYANVRTDENTITWNTAKDNITKQEFRNKLNEFIEKYGYEKAPKEATYDELKDYAKKVIEQHNSFYRGVYPPNIPEDIEAISKLGLTNNDDILKYVATHPREGKTKGLWITPHNNSSIYGGMSKEGKVAIVRRPYTLGEDPTQWFNEGDFTLTRGGTPIESGAIVDPWFNSSNPIGAPTSIPNELVSTSPMKFVRFADGEMPVLSHIRHFPTQEDLIRYNYLNNIRPTAAAETSPYSYSNSKVKDPLTKFFASRKVHGHDYFDFDLPYSKDVHIGLPEEAKRDLMHNTVSRNLREFALDDGAYYDSYKDHINNLLDDVKWNKYSQEDYTKAGMESWGGFYDKDRNFISINEGSSFPFNQVATHEGRHLIDNKSALTTKQENLLSAAYDDDFMNIPNSKYADYMKGYEFIGDERVTTNFDARSKIFEKHNAKYASLEEQDKLIDSLSDKEIFDAVKKSNGYGKRFIQILRDNNKLTPEKAQQIREAMKHVGSVVIPATVGGSILYNNSDKYNHSLGGQLRKHSLKSVKHMF